jgi:hypothetical protein
MSGSITSGLPLNLQAVRSLLVAFQGQRAMSFALAGRRDLLGGTVMSADCQNVTTYAGDNIVLNFTVVDENGNALNLTGATFAYSLAPDEGDVAVLVKSSATVGISVTSAVTGLLSVTILNTDTPLLLGPMWHQLVMTDASGNVSTLMTGIITFKARS